MSFMAKIGAFYARTSIRPHYVSAARVDQRITKQRAKGYTHSPPKPAKDIDYATGTLAGRPLVTLSPKSDAVPGASIFFLHGGAYIYEPLSLHWSFLAKLVRATGRRVHFFLYPKAPEHGFAEIQSTTLAAYKEMCQAEPTPPIVMGDSAGAGLSLRLLQMLRDQSEPLPADAFLLSPWLDCGGTDPASVEIEQNDPMLCVAGLRRAGRLYAGDTSVIDPAVSPLFGDMQGLPRCHVFTSDCDILMPDAQRLVAKLNDINAAPYLSIEPRLYHDWMFTPVPEARGVTSYIVDMLSRADGP